MELLSVQNVSKSFKDHSYTVPCRQGCFHRYSQRRDGCHNRAFGKRKDNTPKSDGDRYPARFGRGVCGRAKGKRYE